MLGMGGPSRLWQRFEEARVRTRVRTEGFFKVLPIVLAVGAAVSLGWRHVFDVGDLGREVLEVADLAIVLAFITRHVAVLALSAHPFAVVRKGPLAHALAAAALAVVLVPELRGDPPLAEFALWRPAATGVKLYLVASEAYHFWIAGITRFRLSPSLVLSLSFMALIGVGTGLLLRPGAAPPAKPFKVVDALFTATSAACVTGLTVRDTGTEISFFGQAVILGLIQAGGLGIMTFAAFFASIFGSGLAIRDQILMRDVLQVETIGRLPRVLAFILLSTLLFEAGGVALLYAFDRSGPEAGRLWTASFHAISAFCNAGFGLYPDSLARFERQPGILAIFAALIVLGGFGYIVLYDLLRLLARGLGALLPLRRRPSAWRQPFSLQSRLVLITSACLIAGGAALLLPYEWDRSPFTGLPVADKVANSLFLSITCRTAGFNVAPIGVFSAGALFVMMILMYIGGSPGSTAGGIKTTTFAVLTARVAALLKHREEIEVFGRTLPRRLIANAVGIVFIQLALIFAVTLGLLYSDPGLRLHQALFEVVSAVGTVGLSRGITPDLSTTGKLLITLAMFTGRVGPLTLLMAMAERPGTQAIFRYPDGKVMIG